MNSNSPVVEPAIGTPSTAVQGYGNVQFNQNAPTFFSADIDEPVFLGATVGHEPIFMHCGQCHYEGLSAISRKRGWFNALLGVATFGLGLLLPGMNTHHHCPRCHRHVAYAKPM
eukprot:g1232.t1